MLTKVICCYSPRAVTTADLSSYVLAAMVTRMLHLRRLLFVTRGDSRHIFCLKVYVVGFSHLTNWTCFFLSPLSLCFFQVAVGCGTRSPVGPMLMSERWLPSRAQNIFSTSLGPLLHVRVKLTEQAVCVLILGLGMCVWRKGEGSIYTQEMCLFW